MVSPIGLKTRMNPGVVSNTTRICSGSNFALEMYGQIQMVLPSGRKYEQERFHLAQSSRSPTISPWKPDRRTLLPGLSSDNGTALIRRPLLSLPILLLGSFYLVMTD